MIAIWNQVKATTLSLVITLTFINSKTSKQVEYKESIKRKILGARGVMVIIVGNGHGDTSSNPGRDWLHFT